MNRGKKKEVPTLMIQGVNVIDMGEEELKQLYADMMKTMEEAKKDEMLERLETDLIRTAWEVAEERLEKLEMENDNLRRDLDAKITQEDWMAGDPYRGRKEEVAKQFYEMEYTPSMEDDELKTMIAGKYVFGSPSQEGDDDDEDDERLVETEGEEGEEEEEEDQIEPEEENIKNAVARRMKDKYALEKEQNKMEMAEQMTPEEKLTKERRNRLAQAGIKCKSWKINVNPDDPDFFRSMHRETHDEVNDMRREIKLYEYDYPLICEEIERKFKRRMMMFYKLWVRDVRRGMKKKIARATKKRLLTYSLIKKHKEYIERKRAKERRKLKMKLISLDHARLKMIENRFKWKGSYLEEKFNMEKMMITENYDMVIKKLKDNHNLVYVNTQQFFRDTAENDILLIMSLKNELKNLHTSMEKMEAEIKQMNAGIKKIEGPLEESEKETRWMETFVAAISKDTKSLAVHMKSNEELQKTINTIKQECKDLEENVKRKEESLHAANLLKESITVWNQKYKDSNAFVKLMKDAFIEDKRKIENMENDLLEKGLILSEHIPLMRELVNKKVRAAKKVHFARQKEVKAYNELVQQLDIRSKDMLITSWPKVYKMGGVAYRKTPANLLATYDERKRYKPSTLNTQFDFVTVKKIG